MLFLFLGFFLWFGKVTKGVPQGLGGFEGDQTTRAGHTIISVIVTIMLIDLVFSRDSIITAVGMVDRIEIMIAAVVVSVVLMMVFAKSIGDFVSNHPSIKMLALSFLVLVGVVLIAEGFEHHIPKGYVYFAMAFSMAVEMLNLRQRARRQSRPVKLHKSIEETAER